MIDGVLVIIVVIGLGAAAILVARSPEFWKRVGQDALTAMLPKFMRAFRPKSITKQELEQVSKGKMPFSKRK